MNGRCILNFAAQFPGLQPAIPAALTLKWLTGYIGKFWLRRLAKVNKLFMLSP